MGVWYMPPFELVRPRDLDGALKHLADWATDTKILAGGTDLLPSLRQRLFEPRYLLAVGHLPELRGIVGEADWVRIGAAETLNAVVAHPQLVAAFPALTAAAAAVAAYTLRNMGTLGGNVCLDTRCHWYNQSYFWRKGIGFCLKKDGSVCHVAPGGRRCWAAYSGDTAAALIALEAQLRLVSPGGERLVPIREFFLNDGQRRFVLRPDEILTEVRIPRWMAGYQARYFKYRVRQAVDYPLVGVAVLVRTSGLRVRDVRVGLTAVNPMPQFFDVPSEWLEAPPEVWVERVAEAVARRARPLKTSLLVSPAYRQYLVRVFVRRGLRSLLALSAAA
jgi:4-hydroxybenzoyl-CoA reductase subunit beta